MRRRSQAAGLLAAPGPAAGAAALELGPEVHRLSLATDARRARAGWRRIDPGGRVRCSRLREALVEQLLRRRLPSRARRAPPSTRGCWPEHVRPPAVRARRPGPGAWRDGAAAGDPPTAGGSALWARTDAGDRARSERAASWTCCARSRPGRTTSWPARRAIWSCGPACARCCAEPSGRRAPHARLTVGALQIDLDAHAVSLHGLPVDLRRLEFELLVHLAGDPERVFAKQELLRAVWGYRSSGSTRTLDSHASRLRRKLRAARRRALGDQRLGRRLPAALTRAISSTS